MTRTEQAEPRSFESRSDTAAVEEVLRANDSSLHALYNGFATDESGGGGDVNTSNERMDLSEWTEFCKSLMLLDKDFTTKDVTLSFIWSRMWIVDEHRKASQKKVSGLDFEDFLEAIIRVAVQKAWPTSDTMEAAGFEADDHFQLPRYLEHLRDNDRKAYDTLLVESAVPWYGKPSATSAECLRCLLKCVMYEVKTVRPSDNPSKISLKDVKVFRADAKNAFRADAKQRR